MASDPITNFFDAIRTSERLRGVRVLLGAAKRADKGSAGRIVLVPVGGPLLQPEHQDNLCDEAVEIHCEVWGKDAAHLWRVRSALLNAAEDYRLAQESVDAPANVQRDRVDFDTDSDTTQDGDGATVVFTLRCPVERTPLTADAGEGDVESILLDGVADVTLTQDEE